MRNILGRISAALLCLYCATVAQSQLSQSTATVPKLVRFSGSFHPAMGVPAPSVESVTLSVYRDQIGGNSLWREIQNVEVDAEGHYSLLLGSTRNEGMPLDLFSSGEPRWLGVQFNRPGETEQPRVLLASVPYALKASDAETLGGLPAAAYLRAPTEAPGPTGSAAIATPLTTKDSANPKPRITLGTTNCIARFTGSADLGCSPMWQLGGSIGLGTTTPGAVLDIQNNAAGLANLLNMKSNYTGSGVGAAGATLSHQHSTMLMRAYSPGAPGTLQNSVGWFALNGSNKLLIGHAGTSVGNDLGFFANNSWANPQMVLTNGGNVGIGTQTPGAKLEVNGNAQVDGGSILASGSVPVIQFPNNGSNNFSAGLGALPNTVPLLPFGNTGNTAVGNLALRWNSKGIDNTASGASALFSNTIGQENTASGAKALFSNTTGSGNTATGWWALSYNTYGQDNTASGHGALFQNTTGSSNTADGFNALSFNTTGSNNTASGNQAMGVNTTGSYNTAMGFLALETNTSGQDNTAVGAWALPKNITGSGNTAIGDYAAFSVTGNWNIAIGYNAGYSAGAGNYNIDIGSQGSSTDNGVIRIGSAQTSAYIAGISGVTTSLNNAVPVLIDSNGNLGTISSSRRYKEDIQDMGEASHDLMRLRPVTFRYKKPFADGSKPVQYGLIAEEVAGVYPDLVAHSADGQIETVKYQVLDSMLLNEVQRQQSEILAQKQLIQALQERLSRLEGALAGMRTGETK